MPFVNVKITAGATNAQKEELIEGITRLLAKVLDKNPASTHVVIEEIEPENWGVGGRTVASLRKAGSSAVSSK